MGSGEDWLTPLLRMGAEAALLKVQATRTFEHCARDAAHLQGGKWHTPVSNPLCPDPWTLAVPRRAHVPSVPTQTCVWLRARQCLRQGQSNRVALPSRALPRHPRRIGGCDDRRRRAALAKGETLIHRLTWKLDPLDGEGQKGQKKTKDCP